MVCAVNIKSCAVRKSFFCFFWEFYKFFLGFLVWCVVEKGVWNVCSVCV